MVITYNPIYYGDNTVTGSGNLSASTDHTILNHILSLIAVGEAPPEVKVFTKPTPIEGAFSTHVEVHQRYPRASLHPTASAAAYSARLSASLRRQRRAVSSPIDDAALRTQDNPSFSEKQVRNSAPSLFPFPFLLLMAAVVFLISGSAPLAPSLIPRLMER